MPDPRADIERILADICTMTCPVCSATQLQPIVVGNTPMLKCPACTAVVSIPERSAEALESFYENEYTLTSTVRESTEKQRYFRYPEYKWLVGSIARYKPSPASWLDVGSDHGFFLDVARRYNYQVEGVELAKNARQYAENIGIRMYKSIDEVASVYDVITMWHVLEHIPTPQEFIGKLRSHMRPDGILAIRVPDFTSLWSKVLKDKWIWFQHKQHVVHYSKKALETLVASQGFTIIRSESRNPNNYLTKQSFDLASLVFNEGRSPVSEIRSRLARAYQDTTARELFIVARK